MADIEEYSPQTGRVIKEDGTTANIGDLLENIDATLTAGIADTIPVATSAVDLSGTTSGAAMGEATTINFGGTSKSIYVKNKDAAETIDVSFDGSTWFALEPGVSIDLDVSRTSIRVKCDTALGVEYTCLVRI